MLGECKECDKYTDLFCMYDNYSCNIQGLVTALCSVLFLACLILFCLKYRVVCRIVRWFGRVKKKEAMTVGEWMALEREKTLRTNMDAMRSDLIVLESDYIFK
jgi:hypothetical protein